MEALFLVLGAKVRIKKGDFSSSLLILAVIANDRETISTLHPTSWKKYKKTCELDSP